MVLAALMALPALAQTPEVKEKPRMYSYVADWTIPRAQWGDVGKSNMSDESVYRKALEKGALIGYGYDRSLLHQPDAPTHDNWFSSMSLAGLMEVLDGLNKMPDPPVILNSTKHSDGIYVSRYYNWKPGSYKDVYTQVSLYKLKADAADNAFDVLARNIIVPLMEKMLADGTIVEYEIDQEAFHTSDPNKFSLVYLAPKAEGLDKVHDAVRAAIAADPAAGVAFGASTDHTAHRDYLLRTEATFK